ncbi:MAG: NUDIX hydrolase [Actinomycetota bacterium]
MTGRRGGSQRIPRPPTARPGALAPWSGLPEAQRRPGLADVRRRLAGLPAPVPGPTPGREAAVLVPIFEVAGEAHVVLIKRPEWMPSHRGEIAFPGGKVEPDLDADARAAALREAHEEIGLAPDAVEVVARLDGLVTVSSTFTIHPFVGLLAERPTLVANPSEVDRILEVPLSELLAEGVHREERWSFERIEEFGVQFFELDDETVWGATARILTGLLARLVADSV